MTSQQIGDDPYDFAILSECESHEIMNLIEGDDDLECLYMILCKPFLHCAPGELGNVKECMLRISAKLGRLQCLTPKQ